MSSTTKKHQNFVSEPMGNKAITDIPGISLALASRLNQVGFNQASQIYGQFLILHGNRAEFEGWLKNKCRANKKQSSDCFNALNEYCDQFQ